MWQRNLLVYSVALFKLKNASTNEKLRKYEAVVVASYKESLMLKLPYRN
jgi:hypothetical protein